VTDDALRRTVRRGIALVVLPLSSIAIGLDEFVWSDYYGASPESLFGWFAFAFVPAVLFLGASGYLLAAGIREVIAVLEPATDRDPQASSD
jgi:hypothetical protein